MSEVEQLENSIANLSDERWDRQIEADANAGKLDKLIEESLADYKSGNSKEL